jgi:hypothetical protein
MDPLSLGLGLFAGWSLLHFWMLPLVVERWKADPLRAKMARAGMLAVLEKLRDLSGVGALTMGAVVLTVGVLAPMAGTSRVLPRAVIAAVAGLYEGTKAFSEQYAGVLGGLALVAAVFALWVAARQARQRVSMAWSEQAHVVFARLRDDPAELTQVLLEPALSNEARVFHELKRACDEATSEGEKSRLFEQLAAVLSAIAVRVAEREVNFADVIAKTTPEAPLAGWRRWVQFATSRQFGKDIGLLRKPLGYVTTSLMLVALVSWSAEPLADSLRLAVNNLRLAVVASEAHRDMEAAMTKATTAVESPPPERATSPPPVLARTVAQQLARAAVNNMIRANLLDHMAGVAAPVPGADSDYVREVLLGEKLAVGDAADDVTRLRAEVAREVATDGTGPAGERTARRAEEYASDALKVPFERLQQQRSGVLERLQTLLTARYAEPYSPFDAQGKLMERMMEVVLNPADLHPADEIGKQAQKLVKDFGRSAIQKWIDASLEHFVTDQIVAATRGEVLAHADTAFESSAQARDFIERVRRESRNGWAPSAAARADREMTQSVAEAVAGRYRVGHEERVAMARSLTGYEGVFPKEDNLPSYLGGGEGALGGVRPGVAGGAPVGDAGAPRGAAPAKPSARGVARSISTNFRLASFSFHARGVLVGQPLEGRAASVTDVRWTVLPTDANGRTRVRLELAEDGQWRTVGLFDAAVVNQALRYAADGRVVATTITPGDDHIIARMTALHPVLADTPLGCRVVEADRLIDTFTLENSFVALVSPKLDELRHDREAIGGWLNFVRVAEMIGIDAAQAKTCPSPDLAKALAKMLARGDISFSPDMRLAVAQFLDARDREHFASTAFLRQASACALGDASTFVSCACRIDRATRTSGAYWMPEDHTSQVREREARVGDDLAWLRRSPDRLGNVDLVVHATFAAHRAADPETPTIDEHTAAELLFPPKELGTLREAFARQMPVYLQKRLHTDNESFLGPVEDFVIVQRVARAAFEKQFADGFPTSKFVALERATRQAVPRQPTIRWEPHADHPKLLEETLVQAGGTAAQSYAAYWEDLASRQKAGAATCDAVSR